jgi:structural maintenance of chromosome 3 (chondroitin sulfate proteoglycan 6)
MPLSQLRPKPAKLPKAADAQAMLDKIKFEKKYEKAFAQVFGKTIVCPTLAIASQYARSHGCNAITPDGDTSNKKGAMTGGYIDPRKSRLEAVRTVNKWRDEYESLRDRALEIRKEVEHKDQEITAAMSELQKLDQKLRQLDDGFDPLKRELRVKNSHIEKQREQLDANLRRREAVERLTKDYSDSIVSFEAELSSDFKKALTANEERQLEQLNNTVQESQRQWNEFRKSRQELEVRKQLLEVDLRENLRLKLDSLNSQAIDTSASSGSGNLREAQKELKKITKADAAVDAKLQESEAQIEQAETKISNLEKEKLHREETQQEIARAVEKHQKKMEKSIQKKALLQQAAAECAKNIRDLGVLPEEAFERFANTESSKVCYLCFMRCLGY